jgi:uracil-DNA glycosylase
MLVRHKAFYKKECSSMNLIVREFQFCPQAKRWFPACPILIEEIDILAPNTVILFGKRTAEFVLKAKGVLEEPMIPGFYKYNNRCIFTTVEENLFTREDAKKLTGFIAARQEDLA